MKILITGVAGFIGFNFSRFLLEKTNFDVVGVDNLNNYYSVNVKKKRLNVLKKLKKFKFIKLDLTNKNKLDKVFKNNFYAVFHFAAQAGVRYSLINPRAYIESNTLGFFNVIEASVTKKIKKIFYASSSSVYGDSKKFPLKEYNSINPKNIYGLTKKNNEEICSLLAENHRISFVGLRFFTVFGEWGRPDMLIYKYLKSIFYKKEKFYLNNYGNHTRDFTYINDINKILLNLLKRNIPKGNNIFNICSNNPIKITKVLELISNEIKIKPQIFKRKFQKADVKKTHGSNKKIKKFTKINKFTNVDYAITSTAKWYKKNWKIFN
jgi:UDP-glucuronate 4-epimerase